MAVNENKVNTTDTRVDLTELLYMFWKSKWVIALLTVVCMSVAFVKVQFFTADTYSADGILYISNKGKTSSGTSAIEQKDIMASRTVSTTYAEILTTRSFLSEVSKDTDGKYTWKQVKGMISVEPLNETELLSIKVNAPTPDDAYTIADSILQNAPEKLTEILKSGDVEIVDYVIKPTAPVGKPLVKTVAIGAIVGIVLGALVVFIKNFFDKKVRRSDEISKRYDIYILGEIAQ